MFESVKLGQAISKQAFKDQQPGLRAHLLDYSVICVMRISQPRSLWPV